VNATRDLAVVIRLNAVIVAVTADTPRVLTVRPGEAIAPEQTMGPGQEPISLPFGPLDPSGDSTLELSLRRWVREQTGLALGYAEQLYTFGDRDREPAERRRGQRVISVAYLALVREDTPLSPPEARWLDIYRFFPWEDGREGRPDALSSPLAPALAAWVEAAPDAAVRRVRRERADIAFGLGGVPWDGERVLDRYELLYEAGWVPEALRDRRLQGEAVPTSPGQPHGLPGRPMVFDHRRILATALGRLRGKIRYRPVVFELLPPAFTLLHLQRVVEALSGVELHKGNFRRLVEKGGLVEGTGKLEARTGGRPAELFRFRRDVLRERPAPGVGLPGVRH